MNKYIINITAQLLVTYIFLDLIDALKMERIQTIQKGVFKTSSFLNLTSKFYLLLCPWILRVCPACLPVT